MTSPGMCSPFLTPECRGLHGEVRILVRAQEVVALQTRVDALLGPGTTQGGLGIEHSQRAIGTDAVTLLGSTQAVPTCCAVSEPLLVVRDSGETDLLRLQHSRKSPLLSSQPFQPRALRCRCPGEGVLSLSQNPSRSKKWWMNPIAKVRRTAESEIPPWYRCVAEKETAN